jgi:mono/diheme cytochrome c family protein
VGRRLSLARIEGIIENPDPPMPKLYPSVLSEQDVDDIAAYVKTL